MFDQVRHKYANEDVSFLGPHEADAFVILPDEVIVEPVSSLQKQLDIAMKALAEMQIEVQVLRAELARRSSADEEEEVLHEEYRQPGTSNTPTPVTPLENYHEHTRIWTQTPSTISIPESSTTCEIDSVQEIAEAINYRRILDRNADMNWHLIVEKIVHYNDQQASVALQQKLKVAPTDQKVAIIDAIIDQAYPLMVNRFGNFLIQRCFEHGTKEQIEAIAGAVRGNVVTLSKDAFGCHVVQKAFDNVGDNCKAEFVQELLKDISTTVTHRYACHVWQKLFEVRWVDSAPEIMVHVNAELYGKWTEVAMGETGSLVVQNIFENCIESERFPCTQEILANIPTIVRGQWGNWIVEHGAEEDREKALDVVMNNAVDYSVDQYASKVIEKAIKSGDTTILARYLSALVNLPENDRIRPRVPLIDIASDQYGNYLIQYILANGDAEQKALVASHIRKHMVSMRGSRYGAKVAFTVERMRSNTSFDDRTTRDYRATNTGRGRASMYKHNYRSSRE
ncbi:Putative uncharacterized protein [Taphrina deformans PYCC 5710]|uniref:PUM-HD domain-containing protein n=1 Tax=Taphrina deformans (strain PYCC 5710 / ATCC 11124 / CBS 356.35 / IMI 108563 / JCM 9778 / NBRC 8474) TaxID=1097556 RepID=R4ZY57_TAPDE|nr:Putative uncharacterized protein [Taphrina deformans PYCC 5710]|eukprot:CCX35443.1 Putative uncharacterized protein [Taphrina deformans PYCC 5710]